MLTMADIADKTPLYRSFSYCRKHSHKKKNFNASHLKYLYRSSMNCDSRRYKAHTRIPDLMRCAITLGSIG